MQLLAAIDEIRWNGVAWDADPLLRMGVFDIELWTSVLCVESPLC